MRAAPALLALLAVLASRTAAAQRGTTAEGAAPVEVPTNVRARVGTAVIARLLRSATFEDRLRGIERAAATATPEALGLLASAAESNTALRSEGRLALALARALAGFAESDRGRSALLALVSAPAAVRSDGGARGDPDAASRLDLARHLAAMAVASTSGDKGAEALGALVRGAGPGHGAAAAALSAYPPRVLVSGSTKGAMSLSPAAIGSLASLHDLRLLGALHAAARSQDPKVRAEAIRALGAAGDDRVLAIARSSVKEPDARLRASAAEALVTLGAPEAPKLVAELLAKDDTALVGAELAAAEPSSEVVPALVERMLGTDETVALAAVRALGRSSDERATRALVAPALSSGPHAYPAMLALARSPAKATEGMLELAARTDASRGLALRGYVVRAVERGTRVGALDDVAAQLARSARADERALGVFVRVALGDADLAAHLDDRDARVRRAAVMGSHARPTPARDRLLLSRFAGEPDASVRALLAAGLGSGDPDGIVPTSMLAERARSGGPDAGLASFVLASRAADGSAEEALAALRSADATMRTQAARGLAFAPLASASGELAQAYASEAEPVVRRAIVRALAWRDHDRGARSRDQTLDLARRLDPDALVRAAASGHVREASEHRASSVTWLRATGGGSGTPALGALLDGWGAAIPFSFDDEGFALVLTRAPGNARVVLAPRLPPYDSSAP